MKTNFSNLSVDFTKSQSEAKERKKFQFRKKTNKAFSRLKSGEKNKMLMSAILNAFTQFKRENLFMQEL